jgi:hypothetical protein
MNRIRGLTLSAAICLTALVLAMPTLPAVATTSGRRAPAGPSSCGETIPFAQVPATKPRSGATLNAVAAKSATDAWGVGTLLYGTEAYVAHLVHGTFVIDAAPVFRTHVSLSGVTFLGKRPLAVGTVGSTSGFARTLALERRGGSWERMDTSVTDHFHDATLTGVAAGSAGTAWAVGSVKHFGRWLPEMLHWNGIRWTRVTIPYPAGGAGLNAVSATRDGEVWAVGYDGAGGFVVHLSNGVWQQIDLPSPAAGPIFTLRSVAAVSVDDVLIGGIYLDAYGESYPLIEHWDGSAWTILPGPTADDGGSLNAIAGGANHFLVAVGSNVITSSGSMVITGSSIDGQLASVPPDGMAYTGFIGVSFVRGTDTAFIVGGADGRPLVYRNCS